MLGRGMSVQKQASAIVLLSAGLDSTVNLYQAVKSFNVPSVLTFDYGQRAVKKEVEKSQQICKALGLTHQTVSLPWLAGISGSSLNNHEQSIPVRDAVCIDDYEVSVETAKSVWVPNRNGVFLNIAAAFAEALQCEYIIPGFNKEEAITFSDNSKEFVDSVDQSLSYSTQSKVKVFCYTADLNKSDIVVLAKELQIPMDYFWPCYFSGDEICKQCESCQRFLRALKQ